jgi:L-asparagine oxygenase
MTSLSLTTSSPLVCQTFPDCAVFTLNDPELCVDYQLMRPLNSQAKWAMDLLGDVLTQQACGAVLQPGDLLIVDNRRAIHARTAFTPRYDGRDRWLQRMFVVEDLRHSQWARATNSLVCAPLDSLITMAAGELHAGPSHAQLLGAPR